MRPWTHLIRFVAFEDDQIHLGQLVDPTRDVGLDSVNGVPIYAFKVDGNVYNGRVTENILQVRKVCQALSQKALHRLSVSQLLSPIVPEECPYIRCIGLNYKLHALEAGMSIPTVPALFSKPRTSIANPYPGTINIPKIAQDNSSDYEAELVIVIGKSARDITAEQAPGYILGYTAANDVSARNEQMKTPMPCFSKGMDSSCPLGPVLVSTAIISDPQNLKVGAIYNSRTVQEGHTSDMIFGVCELIAYLSQGTTIEPGTIILTGTPPGIGYFRSPRIFLGDGDEIRIYIEKIGSLINKVHYE
ncbi:2-keto-4-pentenoate hydratase [Penicillium cataractarum]|uniref:2-keto-4-pentenoate hydratase n=1 Tax=Penicillium cataractarum TaxID=2100454 RepID=A0A9W9RFI7_9EURO|nr:2-keto-4-pentenoate hydratase [Penicillium cataractarum]KAJ5359042.1 2-keto-4-pentenoate hydratase [Penicillium cataractarum]